MKALAVNENRTRPEGPAGIECHTVVVGIHVFTVAKQFQPASEVAIAGIGDAPLPGAVRRSYHDGARTIELGVQVDRSPGQGQRGSFIHLDDGGIIGIDAQCGSGCERKRTFLYRQMGQGCIRIGQGQRTGARLGQSGGRCVHDASRQSRPGDGVIRTQHGNVQGASVSDLDAAGNVVLCHVLTGCGVRISQGTAVERDVPHRAQRAVRANGKNAAVEHCAAGVGIRQVQGDVGRAVHGKRSGGNGVRNITRVVRITDQLVRAAVEDDALGSHGTGDPHFTRFRSGKIDFLVVQRIHSRQLRSPAADAGVDPLAVRSAVPDKTIVSADVHDFQHELVVFHHDGVFKAFPGDVRRPGEGIRGQAARRSPLGQDVVGCFQFTIVVDGQRAVGIRQSQGPCLDIDDRAVCYDSSHVKDQRSAAVQRQGGGRGHPGARAHGDAAQRHGVRVGERQRAAVHRGLARVGILCGQGQGAGAVFDKAACSRENTAKRNGGTGLVVIRFGPRIILTRINRQFTAKSHVLGRGPAFRRRCAQRSRVHVQGDRI